MVMARKLGADLMEAQGREQANDAVWDSLSHECQRVILGDSIVAETIESPGDPLGQAARNESRQP